MPDSETLSHTKWDCKYHVVFIPKYRRKALYHELRRHLGEVFRALAEQKECRIWGMFGVQRQAELGMMNRILSGVRRPKNPCSRGQPAWSTPDRIGWTKPLH